MTPAPTVAMVLAAGRGKRLGALGVTTPKPLVKIGGRALLDHVLDEVAAAGVQTAVVNIHHLPDQVRAHLAARRAAPRVVLSDESDELLETGGGVVKALPLLPGDAFFVLNSDVVRPAPATGLVRLADAWLPDRMDFLLLLQPYDRTVGFEGAGDYRMAADGRLHWRGTAPAAPYVYAGALLCRRAVFDGAPSGAFSLKRLFDKAEAAGRLFGVVNDGLWLHVGSPEGIAAAEAALAMR